MCASNNTVSDYIKQKLTELKGNRDKSTELMYTFFIQ